MPRQPLIAVIDDDESFRIALADSLSSLGYDAQAFASAEDFIAEGGEGSYDCIITDIHMTGMNGFDLRRLLASRGSKIPVIMITARAEAGLEAKAMAGGAVALLRKPFQSDALTDCVEKALKG